MIDVRRIPKGPILLFMASRYTSYGLNFLRGMLMAKFLGPEIFGVWGFLMLMHQYLAFSSLGLQYSVTVELATDLTKIRDEQARFIGAVLALTGLISLGLVVFGLGIQLGSFSLFEKYSFNQYALALSMVVAAYHYQQIFANVYRVYGKLTRIAVSELLNAVAPLIALLAFRDTDLIGALLVTMAMSGCVSIGIFKIRAPFEIRLNFAPSHWKKAAAIGIPLLIYNASFYLITMSSRTVVSVYYPPEVMGYYSFANTITTATLLGLSAVSWVAFPHILSKTQMDVPNYSALRVVQRVNDLYGTSVFIAVFAMIFAIPLLFFFLPQYRSSAEVLGILLLSQAVLSISFGYNSVAIARKQQMMIALIGIFVAAVVAGLSLLIGMLRLDIAWIAVAVFVGTLISSLWQMRLGADLVGQDRAGNLFMIGILPWGSLVATLVLLVGILTGYPAPAGVLASSIFLWANRQKIGQLWIFVKQRLGMSIVRT